MCVHHACGVEGQSGWVFEQPGLMAGAGRSSGSLSLPNKTILLSRAFGQVSLFPLPGVPLAKRSWAALADDTGSPGMGAVCCHAVMLKQN